MSKGDGAGLPKSVAGFKIPKALRKAKQLDGLLDTQEGRDLVADALLSAAQAVATVIRNHRPSQDSEPHQQDGTGSD